MRKEGTFYKSYGLIGLISAYDYGFASSLNNWQISLNQYYKNENNNRENNWMFNIREWSMSNYYSGTYSTIRVGNSGGISSYDGSNIAAMHPVFYLKPDVVIDGSNGANGSMASPLRVLA